jgi:hypothetical protein
MTRTGIDLQVYHPATNFKEKRPHWMHKEGTKQIPLPQEVIKYKRHLIQVYPRMK